MLLTYVLVESGIDADACAMASEAPLECHFSFLYRLFCVGEKYTAGPVSYSRIISIYQFFRS